MNILRGAVPPYPSTDGIIKNNRISLAVSALRLTKLNMISDYIYYSLLLKSERPELSLLLDRIAGNELLHFRLLGELMLALGANPSVRGRILTYTTDFVQSDEDLRTLLERVIKSENDAYRAYINLALEGKGDPKLDEFLRRLASDDENHERIFSLALRKEFGEKQNGLL